MSLLRNIPFFALVLQMGSPVWGQAPAEAKHPGEAIYTRPGMCSTCHQLTGEGIPGAFPPLVGTDWVTGDPIRLIKVVDKGLEGKLSVNGKDYNSVMPAQGGMISDQELTDVLNYIRSSWGNQAKPIPLEDVAKLRAQYKDQEGAWEAHIFEKAVYETGNSMLRELYGKVYHGAWSNYVDFASNAVVTAEGTLEENLISDALAPPGDDYAYEYSGKIIAPGSGRYEFLSGTKFMVYLWVDGQKVLFKDQTAQWPSDARNSIMLTQGEHDFRFLYLNPGERVPIALSWTGPELFVENRALSRRKTQESAVYSKATLLNPINGNAVLYRNFIKNSGPRSIAVGYPGELNMCFDAEKLQWSLLWGGTFINGGLHWSGRGQGQQLPDSPDTVSLSLAQPFAHLDSEQDRWPKIENRAPQYEFRGYVLDHKRFPAFHYEYGDLQIEEKPLPQNGEKLFRQLRIRSPRAHSNLYFHAASGTSIEALDDDTYIIDDEYTVHLWLQGEQKALLRKKQGKQELLIHSPLERGNSCLDDWTEFPLTPIPTETIYSTTIEQEYSWKR